MEWIPIVGKALAPNDFNHYVRSLGPAPAWVKFCVLHNTAVPSIAQRPKGFTRASMDSLVSFYRNTQHWHAGPHLFVDMNAIWVFTPLIEHGVHSPSWNDEAFGIEMLGNFESEPFATGDGAKIRDNAITALAVLHDWAKLDSATLKLHKEDPKTTHDCPGKNVSKADVIVRLHHTILGLRAGANR